MNEIVTNAQTFLEVLQTATTAEVEEWDLKAMQSAVQWAKYFEVVHRKLWDRTKNIEQLNRALHLIGCLPGAPLSHSTITYESLSQSVRLLLQVLLQNTSLKADLYNEVIRQYRLLDYDNDNKEHTTTCGGQATAETELGNSEGPLLQVSGVNNSEDISQFAMAKATKFRLVDMRLKLTQALAQEMDVEGQSVQQVAMETDASLLQDHIIHHVTNQPTDNLDSCMHDIAKLPRGLETIGAICAVSGIPDDCDDDERMVVAKQQGREFVVKWMEENRHEYSSADDGNADERGYGS